MLHGKIADLCYVSTKLTCYFSLLTSNMDFCKSVVRLSCIGICYFMYTYYLKIKVGYLIICYSQD